MSYYFTIIGTRDNPLFSHEFGTSKSGGDGVARFRDDARHMNQFIVHSSLDIVEEVMWISGAMYLKSIDRFHNSYISCFLPNTHTTFLLLHNPDPSSTSTLPYFSTPSSSSGGSAAALDKRASIATSAPSGAGGRQEATSSLGAGVRMSSGGGGIGGIGAAASGIGGNPLSQQTEEAVRQFFLDVYENWVKTVMNPFYETDAEVRSPVFRARVAASARKYL